jgi:hypothetical protein
LVGALFALALWSFERQTPRSLLTADLQEQAKQLLPSVSARWRRRLRHAGLAPKGQWTRELIEQRAILERAVVLTETELKLSVAALKLVELEFSANWGEFCVVVPGNIDWYGLLPDGLAQLRSKLEAAAAAGPGAT